MEEVVVAVSVVAPLLLLVVVLIKCLGCLRKKEGFKNFENEESRMESRINPGFIMGQDVEEPEQPVTSTTIQIEPLPEILSETTPRKPKIACVEKSKQESALKLVVMNNPHPFPRRQLKYLNEIGTGWFGHVLESDAEHITTGIPLSRVVAKVLKDDASNAEKKLFLEDVIPYRELEHSNILRLLGQCTESAPFLMILESAKMGDLKACLRRQKTQGNFHTGKYQLVKFAIDAASGMACLHRHGYIHQDFAARNCLVMADYTVKVGDYGIAEDGYRDDYYNSGKEVLPIRWMSPESLSQQSGDWQTAVITKEANICFQMDDAMVEELLNDSGKSYGVLIWEVLMFGCQPYTNMSDTEVLQSVIADRMIKLPEPDVDIQYKDRIVEVMQFCWLNPGQRPSIEEAHGLLQRLANIVTGAQEKEENFEKQWNQMIPSEARIVSAKPQAKQQKWPPSASFDSDFVPAPKLESVILDEVTSPALDDLMSVKVEGGLSTSIVNMPPGIEQDLEQLPTPSQPKLPALMTSTPVIDPAFTKSEVDAGEKLKKSNASGSRTSRKIEDDFEKLSTATVESSLGSRSSASPLSVEKKKPPDVGITIPPKESAIDLLKVFDKSKPEPSVSPETTVDMLGGLKTEGSKPEPLVSPEATVDMLDDFKSEVPPPAMGDTPVDLFESVQKPVMKESQSVPEAKPREEESTDGGDVHVDLVSSDIDVDLLSKGTGGDLLSVDACGDLVSKDTGVDLLSKDTGVDLFSNDTSGHLLNKDTNVDLLSKDTNVDLLGQGDASEQVQDVPSPASLQIDPFASLLPASDIQKLPQTDSTAKCDMQSPVSGLDDKPSEVGKQTSSDSSAESDANINKLSLVHSSDVELVSPSNYEKQSTVDMNSDNLIPTTFQPVESLPSEVEMKQGVDDPISKAGEEKKPDKVIENGLSGYETHSVVDQSKSESHDDSTASGAESSSDSAVCVSSPELADAPSSFDGAAPSSDKVGTCVEYVSDDESESSSSDSDNSTDSSNSGRSYDCEERNPHIQVTDLDADDDSINMDEQYDNSFSDEHDEATDSDEDMDLRIASELYLSKGVSSPQVFERPPLETIPEDVMPSPSDTSSVDLKFDAHFDDVFASQDNFEWDDFMGESIVGRDRTGHSPKKSFEMSDWMLEGDSLSFRSNSSMQSPTGSVSSDVLGTSDPSIHLSAASGSEYVSQRPISEGTSVSPLNEANEANQILAGEFKMSDKSLLEGSTAVSSGAGQGDRAVQGSGQGQDRVDNEITPTDHNSAFEKLASQHDIGLDMFGSFEESNTSEEQYNDFKFGSFGKSDDIDLFGDFSDTENTDKPDVPSVSTFFTGIDVPEGKGNVKVEASAKESDRDVRTTEEGFMSEVTVTGIVLYDKSEELTKVNNEVVFPVGSDSSNVEDSKSPDERLQNVNESESDCVNSKLNITSIDSSVSQSFLEVDSSSITVDENLSELVTEEHKEQQTQSLIDPYNSTLDFYEVLRFSDDKNSVTEEVKENVLVPSVDSTFAFSLPATHAEISGTSESLGEVKMEQDLDTDKIKSDEGVQNTDISETDMKTSEEQSESFVVLNDEMIKDSVQTNLKVSQSCADTKMSLPDDFPTEDPETAASLSLNESPLTATDVGTEADSTSILDAGSAQDKPKDEQDSDGVETNLEPSDLQTVDFTPTNENAVSVSETNEALDMLDQVLEPREIVDVLDEVLEPEHDAGFADTEFDMSEKTVDSSVNNDIKEADVGQREPVSLPAGQTVDMGHSSVHTDLLSVTSPENETNLEPSNLQTEDFTPTNENAISVSETNEALDMLDQVLEPREIVDVLDEVLEPEHDAGFADTEFDMSEKTVDSSVNNDIKEADVGQREPVSLPAGQTVDMGHSSVHTDLLSVTSPENDLVTASDNLLKSSPLETIGALAGSVQDEQREGQKSDGVESMFEIELEPTNLQTVVPEDLTQLSETKDFTPTNENSVSVSETNEALDMLDQVLEPKEIVDVLDEVLEPEHHAGLTHTDFDMSKKTVESSVNNDITESDVGQREPVTLPAGQTLDVDHSSVHTDLLSVTNPENDLVTAPDNLLTSSPLETTGTLAGSGQDEPREEQNTDVESVPETKLKPADLSQMSEKDDFTPTNVNAVSVSETNEALDMLDQVLEPREIVDVLDEVLEPEHHAGIRDADFDISEETVDSSINIDFTESDVVQKEPITFPEGQTLDVDHSSVHTDWLSVTSTENDLVTAPDNLPTSSPLETTGTLAGSAQDEPREKQNTDVESVSETELKPTDLIQMSEKDDFTPTNENAVSVSETNEALDMLDQVLEPREIVDVLDEVLEPEHHAGVRDTDFDMSDKTVESSVNNDIKADVDLREPITLPEGRTLDVGHSSVHTDLLSVTSPENDLVSAPDNLLTSSPPGTTGRLAGSAQDEPREEQNIDDVESVSETELKPADLSQMFEKDDFTPTNENAVSVSETDEALDMLDQVLEPREIVDVLDEVLEPEHHADLADTDFDMSEKAVDSTVNNTTKESVMEEKDPGSITADQTEQGLDLIGPGLIPEQETQVSHTTDSEENIEDTFGGMTDQKLVSDQYDFLAVASNYCQVDKVVEDSTSTTDTGTAHGMLIPDSSDIVVGESMLDFPDAENVPEKESEGRPVDDSSDEIVPEWDPVKTTDFTVSGSVTEIKTGNEATNIKQSDNSMDIFHEESTISTDNMGKSPLPVNENTANIEASEIAKPDQVILEEPSGDSSDVPEREPIKTVDLLDGLSVTNEVRQTQEAGESSRLEQSIETLDSLDQGENALQDNFKESPQSASEGNISFTSQTSNTGEVISEQLSGSSSDTENVPRWEPIQTADLMDVPASSSVSDIKTENISHQSVDIIETFESENVISADNLEESPPLEKEEDKLPGGVSEVQDTLVPDLSSGLLGQPAVDSSHLEPASVMEPFQTTDILSEISVPCVSEAITDEKSELAVDIMDSFDKEKPTITDNSVSSLSANEHDTVSGFGIEAQDVTVADAESSNAVEPGVKSSDLEFVPEWEPIKTTDMVNDTFDFNTVDDSKTGIDEAYNETSVDNANGLNPMNTISADEIEESPVSVNEEDLSKEFSVETQDTSVVDLSKSEPSTENMEVWEPIQTTDMLDTKTDSSPAGDHVMGSTVSSDKEAFDMSDNFDQEHLISNDNLEESFLAADERNIVTGATSDTKGRAMSDSSDSTFNQSSSDSSSDSSDADVSEWEPIRTSDLQGEEPVLDSKVDVSETGNSATSFEQSVDMLSSFDTENSNFKGDSFAENKPVTVIDEVSDTKNESLIDTNSSVTEQDSSDLGSALDWEPLKTSDFVAEVHDESPENGTEIGLSASKPEQSVNISDSFSQEDTILTNNLQGEPLSLKKENVRDVFASDTQDPLVSESGDDPFEQSPADSSEPWEPMKTSDLSENNAVNQKQHADIMDSFDSDNYKNDNTTHDMAQTDSTLKPSAPEQKLFSFDEPSLVTNVLDEAIGGQPSSEVSNTENEIMKVPDESFKDSFFIGDIQSVSAEVTPQDNTLTGGFDFNEGNIEKPTEQSETVAELLGIQQPESSSPVVLDISSSVSPDGLSAVLNKDGTTPLDQDGKDLLFDQQPDKGDSIEISDSRSTSDPFGTSDPFAPMSSLDQISENPFSSGTSEMEASKESNPFFEPPTLNAFSDSQPCHENFGAVFGSSAMPKQPSFDAQTSGDISLSNPFSDDSDFASVSVIDTAQIDKPKTSDISTMHEMTEQQLNSLNLFAGEGQRKHSAAGESNLFAESPSDTTSVLSDQNRVINPFLESEQLVSAESLKTRKYSDAIESSLITDSSSDKISAFSDQNRAFNPFLESEQLVLTESSNAERTLGQESMSSVPDSVGPHDQETLSDFVDLGVSGYPDEKRQDQKPADSDSQLTDSLLDDFVKVSTDSEVAPAGSESMDEHFASPKQCAESTETQPVSEFIESESRVGEVSKSAVSSEEPTSDFMFLGNDQVEKSQSNESFSDISDGFKESSNLGQSIIDFPDSSMTDSQESAVFLDLSSDNDNASKSPAELVTLDSTPDKSDTTDFQTNVSADILSNQTLTNVDELFDSTTPASIGLGPGQNELDSSKASVDNLNMSGLVSLMAATETEHNSKEPDASSSPSEVHSFSSPQGLLDLSPVDLVQTDITKTHSESPGEGLLDFSSAVHSDDIQALVQSSAEGLLDFSTAVPDETDNIQRHSQSSEGLLDFSTAAPDDTDNIQGYSQSSEGLLDFSTTAPDETDNVQGHSQSSEGLLDFSTTAPDDTDNVQGHSQSSEGLLDLSPGGIAQTRDIIVQSEPSGLLDFESSYVVQPDQSQSNQRLFEFEAINFIGTEMEQNVPKDHTEEKTQKDHRDLDTQTIDLSGINVEQTSHTDSRMLPDFSQSGELFEAQSQTESQLISSGVTSDDTFGGLLDFTNPNQSTDSSQMAAVAKENDQSALLDIFDAPNLDSESPPSKPSESGSPLI